MSQSMNHSFNILSSFFYNNFNKYTNIIQINHELNENTKHFNCQKNNRKQHNNYIFL